MTYLKFNTAKAFTQKKLKISGNMSIAMKLNQVFASVAAKKSSPAPAPKPVETKAAASSSNLSLATTKHKSGKFFEDIEAKLKQDPSMVTKVNAIIGFQVACDNDKTMSYIIDLKNSPGSVFVNNGSKFKMHSNHFI